MRILSLATLAATCVSLAACAPAWKPPEIAYDDTPRRAVLEADPPKPVKVVEIPRVLPLPGQLKPLPDGKSAPPEPADPRARVDQANGEARVPPTRAGYLNAIQVYPFSDGALYQVYAALGEITDIALERGEQLVGSGPGAATRMRSLHSDIVLDSGSAVAPGIIAMSTAPLRSAVARRARELSNELRKPLGEVDQCRAKIAGRERRVEPDRKPASLAAARALRSRRQRFHLLQD
jgi:type IV secretion system protein TrbG